MFAQLIRLPSRMGKGAAGHIRRNTEGGFTIIELVSALGLLALLGAVAAFNFQGITLPFDRMNARTILTQDLKRAQAEAVTWGCRGIFVLAANGRSYSYGCDFLAYDTNVPPTADTIFFSRTLPSRIRIEASAPIIFSSRGQVVDVEGHLTNVVVDLIDASTATPATYASGTLLGTGAFAMEFG